MAVIVVLKIYYMSTHIVKQYTCQIVRYVHYCDSMALIVRWSKLKVVKYLIEAQGCSADCTDKVGLTPLHYACP